MKNVIFIAPPAAGKGTQSDLLGKKYNYKHISTGDLLREVDPESDLGIKIHTLIDKGEFVSDELITELLKDAMKNISGPFILDGYPRNIFQAESLKDLFLEIGVNDFVVIYLDIDKEEAMKRALGRLSCSKCHAIYNKYNADLKPIKENVCDKCGTIMEVRTDDNEEAFQKRFQTYLDNTKPVLDYYSKLDLLKIVEVDNDKMVTFDKIVKIIEE